MTTATLSLNELKFRQSSPAALRKAAAHGLPGDFQKAMTDRHRVARKRLEKAFASDASTILWSVGGGELTESEQQLVSQLSGGRKQRRAARKQAVEAVIEGDTRPLMVLTAVETLVRCGSDLKAANYAELYCALSRISEIVPSQPPEDDNELAVLRLICDGELPLILSLVLQDLKGQTGRFKAAVKSLREGLAASTDSDGMLHAGLIPAADVWLAPLVRATRWSQAFGASWLNPKTEELFADAARCCASLMVQTGLVSDPPDDFGDSDRSALQVTEQAMKSIGLRETSPWLSLVRAYAQPSRRRVKSGKRARRIQASNQSDWAESAILRSGLQADSDVCVVTWDQPESSIHMGVLGTSLLSGTWSSEVTVDGETIGPIEEWHCSCWFCDDEAAFVELEADPSESIHVVRHVMLSMQDHQAVICESVTTPNAEAEVRLKNQLPLAADPLAVTNSITRELVLHADCVSARVVPAWLEDDRVLHATGRCEKDDGVLVSEVQGVGGVTAPLLLDWHPERQALDADWNRLTVTEAREVLSGQRAAGFRVRIGRRQTLIYRSLQAATLPRAVMGLHTLNETVYGRVKKSGEVAPLVLVEGE